MRAEEFRNYLERFRTPGNLSVGEPAPASVVADAEKRLGLTFPDQVRWLYESCNGLSVRTPALVVRSLEELALGADGLIPFATFDAEHVVAFDTSKLNAASQWSIVNAATGFVVTLTAASFWSNKMPAWLRSQRPVWGPEHFDD